MKICILNYGLGNIRSIYNAINKCGYNVQLISKDKKIINSPNCKKAIKIANQLIKNKGRLLIRPSGTEPKVRIMCESFNLSLINKCIDVIKKTIH